MLQTEESVFDVTKEKIARKVKLIEIHQLGLKSKKTHFCGILSIPENQA